MFDGAHALADRAGDGLRRISMGLRVATEGIGLLDGGADFIERELPAVERVIGARHTARHHDLDLVDTLAKLLAHRGANGIDAIDDLKAETHRIAALASPRPCIGAPARVGMAARGPNGAPRDEHARTGQETLRHPVAHAPIRAAGITYRRETAIDHRAHQSRGADRHHGQRDGFEISDVHFGEHHVNMAIDQAGHQRAAFAVDHVGIARLDRARGDFADRLAFDEHRNPALERSQMRIEQIGVLEQDLRHSKILRAPATAWP